MLARTKRIPKSEFPSFKDKGIRFLSTLFSGTAYPSSVGTRVSVVVSKKTAKSAVERNRIRRRVYGAVEPYLLMVSRGARIIFYPKKEAKKAPASQLQKEIKEALQKIKLLS